MDRNCRGLKHFCLLYNHNLHWSGPNTIVVACVYVTISVCGILPQVFSMWQSHVISTAIIHASGAYALQGSAESYYTISFLPTLCRSQIIIIIETIDMAWSWKTHKNCPFSYHHPTRLEFTCNTLAIGLQGTWEFKCLSTSSQADIRAFQILASTQKSLDTLWELQVFTSAYINLYLLLM